MNRQQAINYLLSSGFSEEQIDTIEQAFKQEPTTAVVIPKGATNKDVFKAIFGYEPATDAVICNKEDWCGASEPCSYCISNSNNVGREEEWWNAEYKELTTKNDLGVDCISRADAIRVASGYCHPSNVAKELAKLPSVTPQEPRWIPVNERLPEEHICDDGFHEPSKSVLVQMKSGAMHTARYWSRYDERWLDLNYPTTDEVIAWIPLPAPFEPQESEG